MNNFKLNETVMVKPIKGMDKKYITVIDGNEVIAKIGDYKIIESDGLKMKDYQGSDIPDTFIIESINGNEVAVKAESSNVTRYVNLDNLIKIN